MKVNEGASCYPFPRNVDEIECRVFLSAYPHIYKMVRVSEENMRPRYQVSPPHPFGVPIYFSVEEGIFSVWPAPNAQYEVEVKYRKKPNFLHMWFGQTPRWRTL